jgi:hypothetical protein
MHVPLRRHQILMARELLNRPRRRAAHGEMRTERVAQSMDATLTDLRASCGPLDVMLHGVRRQSRSIRVAKDAW